MTIKGIPDFFRKHNIKKYHVPLTELSNKQIVIDGNNLCHTRFWGVKSRLLNRCNLDMEIPSKEAEINNLKESVLTYLYKFIKHKCITIIVFDGAAPPEKFNTITKRRDQHRNARDRYNDIVNKLNVIYEEGDIPSQELKDEFKSLYKRVVLPTRNMMNKVADHIKKLGVPVLYSIGEGDGLCASLVMEGYCVMAISGDHDILVYGCDLLATDYHIDNIDGVEYIHGIYVLDEILKDLNLNMSEFQNLCICSGCDYNINKRGYGPAKIYRKIQNDNIEDIITYESVNYARCMEMFKYRPSTSLIDTERSSILIGFGNSEDPDNEGRYYHLIDNIKNSLDYVSLRDKSPITGEFGTSYSGHPLGPTPL